MLNDVKPDVMSCFEWLGKATCTGTPDMFLCSNWNAMACHLKLVMYPVNELVGYFVNQVSGMHIILSQFLYYFY